MFSLPNSFSYIRRGWWLVILLSLLALILAHWIALIYRIQPTVSLWFPPSGVAIALALWFGPIGVILTGIVSILMAPFWGIDGWARLAGLIDTIEPLVAWLLYRRFAKGWLSFKRLSDAAAFIISGSLIACGTSAVIGNLTLVALDKVPMSSLAIAIPNWWLGNALGTMAIAPTALLVLTPRLQRRGWVLHPRAIGEEGQNLTSNTQQQAQDFPPPCLLRPNYRAEVAAILLLSGFTTAITVWQAHQGGYAFQQVSFLSFVPIIWAASRFGVTGGMLVSTFCVLTTLVDYILLYPNALSLPNFPLPPEVLHIHKLSLLVQCSVSLLVGCAATERAAIQVALAVQQVRAVEYEARAQLSEQLMELNNELTETNTRLQESHEQLYRREEEFKALVENSPDVIARFDRELRHLYVNSAVEQEAGIPAQTFIGKTLLELGIPKKIAAAWQKNIQEVFDTGEERVVEFDAPLRRKIRYFQSRLVPEFSQDGTIASVLAVTRNITNIRQAEAALRQSEAKMRRLVDSNLIGVIFVDLEGKIADANQAFLQIVGYSSEEVLSGKISWNGMTPPEYVAQDELVIAELKKSGICKPFEKEYIRKDGSRVPVLIGAAMLEGSQQESVCFVLDLTKRKQAEAEREKLLQRVQAQGEILEAILQQMPVGVILSEAPSGKIVFGNQQTEEILRQPLTFSSNIEDYSRLNIFKADGEPYKFEEMPMARSITKDEVIKGEEVTVQRGDGSKGILSINSAPIKDRQGHTVAAVVAFYDISDRKQAEQEREELLASEQQARTQAENANRIKDEFLAILSHELRSPLNPILGWVKLLRTRKFDREKTDRALETIERNTRLQTQLIDDLLDVSRILRGKLSLNITQVNLTSTIQAAMETVRLAAEAKSIDLIFSISDTQENSQFLLKGDANRLQQIVWNLLSNAIKFTPERGRVEVKLSLEESRGASERGNWGTEENSLHAAPHNRSLQPSSSHSPVAYYAQIQVIDTGKGISQEFLPHVFEHFRQADSSITRQYGGLGLGLAIVRNLVEIHGGTIRAESQGEGMGATFTVRLPLLKNKGATKKAELNLALSANENSSSLLAGLRILVVDDDDDTRELINFVLEDRGAETKAAASVSEAFEVLEEFKPDILVCDIGMPQQDGYTLISRLRSSEDTSPIPAIALTAYATDRDKEKALSAGFQLHLSKPVDTTELVKAIAKLLGTGEGRDSVPLR